jgi:hypothetical protein
MLKELIEGGNLVTVLSLLFSVLVVIGAILFVLLRSKREIEGKVKHGKTEASIKIGGKKEKDETVEKKGEAVKQLSQQEEFDLDKLINHRFFTSVLCQYTTDNCNFNLYDETLRVGVIKDVEEVANFKKLIASRFLNLCLFKVLGEHVRSWITDVVNEVKEKNDFIKVPNTFYTISQYITKYKNEAYKQGKSIEFTHMKKAFYGIPTPFMKRFNNWSESNMNRVYNMISDVLYSTQNTWFAKTIELLDLFEVIFMMLHDQMDATLIILNGEIAHFLKKVKESPDEVEEVNAN